MQLANKILLQIPNNSHYSLKAKTYPITNP